LSLRFPLARLLLTGLQLLGLLLCPLLLRFMPIFLAPLHLALARLLLTGLQLLGLLLALSILLLSPLLRRGPRRSAGFGLRHRLPHLAIEGRPSRNFRRRRRCAALGLLPWLGLGRSLVLDASATVGLCRLRPGLRLRRGLFLNALAHLGLNRLCSRLCLRSPRLRPACCSCGRCASAADCACAAGVLPRCASAACNSTRCWRSITRTRGRSPFDAATPRPRAPIVAVVLSSRAGIGGAFAANTSRAVAAAGGFAPGRDAAKLALSGTRTGAAVVTGAALSVCDDTVTCSTGFADTNASRRTTVTPEGARRLA
jgi:hypothetical protein